MSTKKKIHYDGDVGIGTTNPEANLHVRKSIDPSDASSHDIIKLSVAGDINQGPKGCHAAIALSKYDNLYNYPRTRIDFKTTGKEDDNWSTPVTIMSLKDDGNVGVGTTDPKQRLSVNGNITVGHRWGQWNDGNYGPAVQIGKPDGSGSWGIGSAFLQFKDSETDNNVNKGTSMTFHVHTYGGGTNEALRIAANRNVGIGTATPQEKLHVEGKIKCTQVDNSSDLRLKKDIKPLENALHKVIGLKGVNYKWKDASMGDTVEMGLIAQEVEKVFPEVVTSDREGIKSIAYSKIVAVLIEATKEQQEQIETLKKEVAKLKVTE